MIRRHLTAQASGEKHFQWRGADITRLEHFSDAVFAFAVTLLVVSLEVPKNFTELMAALRGFVAFGACFAMLVVVWVYHCQFFRRYGLQGAWITLLNSVLLFCVLFYVYPLKFLAFAMFAGTHPTSAHDFRMIVIVYGSGYAAVFVTFALMYLHAWGKRKQLALNEMECLRTRHILINHLAIACIGCCSVALAIVLPERLVSLAGYFYFVILVYFIVSGVIFRRHRRRVSAGMTPHELPV